MKSYLAAVACATLLTASATKSAAAGIVYDLSADFSASANPNGVWVYGDEATLGGSLKLYTQVPPSTFGGLNNGGYDIWGDTGAQYFYSFAVPSVLYNPASSAEDSFAGVEIPGLGVSLHPGYDGELSVARFTAPIAGAYTLDFDFTSADTRSGGATADYVLDNGATLYSGHIESPIGSDSFAMSGVSLTLAAGDEIDFVVGQYQGRFYDDSTQVAATFNGPSLAPAAPEPSTWAMMLIGFAGLAYVGCRQAGALR